VNGPASNFDCLTLGERALNVHWIRSGWTEQPEQMWWKREESLALLRIKHKLSKS